MRLRDAAAIFPVISLFLKELARLIAFEMGSDNTGSVSIKGLSLFCVRSDGSNKSSDISMRVCIFFSYLIADEIAGSLVHLSARSL